MAKGSRGGKRSGSGAFTKNQKEAIEYYASGDGMFINNHLRERNGMTINDLTPQDKQFMKDLDDALDKRLNEQILYRSVDASAVFGNMESMEFEQLRGELLYNEFSSAKGAYSQGIARQVQNKINSATGKTITDKGYVSTTRDATIAENFGGYTGSSNPIVMKIKTSKNTKGADISKATKRLSEIEKNDPQKETLLARNQKYKINKIYSKNGQIYVDVEM